MRFGYRRLTAMLVREGMPVNHKRVFRLYREEGLAMRIRQRRRIHWNGFGGLRKLVQHSSVHVPT